MAHYFTNDIVKDYTYTLVRKAMESESDRKNMIISYVFSELINRNTSPSIVKNVFNLDTR